MLILMAKKVAIILVPSLYMRVCAPKKLTSNFSFKTYSVGTQKNRLNETALLSSHNIC